MVIVTWVTRGREGWCSLDRVDLRRLRTTGVYVVWYGGSPGRVVCVGQGDIATELGGLQSDKKILAHKAKGDLLVTWAEVSPARIDGIARYVRETWPPLIAGDEAEAAAIEVNSPGLVHPFV